MATACRSEQEVPAGASTLGVLLRPGWIAAALLVVAFTAACVAVLAPWQFGKSEQVELRAKTLQGAGAKRADPLEEVQSFRDAVGPADEWRQVTVRGRFLPGHEVLVPNRVSADGSSTHVVSPFVVVPGDEDDDDNAGAIILVNRGAAGEGGVSGKGVPSSAGISPPPLDVTEITAQLRSAEEASRYAPPRVEDGTVVASAIDPAQLSDVTGLALAPFHLQLSPGQAGALGELPLPSAESSSPHFSYGVQWLALGAAAPIALGALARSHVRREKQDHAG